MAEHPTASWQAIQNGNVFYRQQRLYTLDGKLQNLGDSVVAGCRNGGPLGASDYTSWIPALSERVKNSSDERYYQNDRDRARNTYVRKVANSSVLTVWGGLTAVRCMYSSLSLPKLNLRPYASGIRPR